MVSSIETHERIVYLTFDDGPEPGICEYVLETLYEYGFKATFFCRGDNAEKYPDLIRRIADDGHTLGNHTYSHLCSFNTFTIDYVEDVDKCNQVINSSLFRPPHASITFSSWVKLKNKYKFYYWSVNSGDSDLCHFDIEKSRTQLNKTRSGDIILFHFCSKHEKETRQLLSDYCKWLSENGYRSCIL